MLSRHRLIERHRLFEFTRPIPPSSSVCIRLPAPARSTRLALRKIRSWRRGIGPTSVAPTTAVDVERRRSGLAAPCRLHSIADRHVGFCLYAFDDDSGCRGFIAARLEARPKHLSRSPKRSHHGQHRDCDFSWLRNRWFARLTAGGGSQVRTRLGGRGLMNS